MKGPKFLSLMKIEKNPSEKNFGPKKIRPKKIEGRMKKNQETILHTFSYILHPPKITNW